MTPPRGRGKSKTQAFPKSRTMSGDCLFDITGNTGSLRYMAPEVARHQHYNHKCEVYSFGVIMFEIIEQKLPFDRKNPRIMMEEVFSNNHWREPLNKIYWPFGLDELIERCWHQDIDKRPEFSEIVEKLTEVAKAVEEDREERLKNAGCLSCLFSMGNEP